MLQTADIHSRRRRGMSLVELIVAIAIFTTIMSGVVLMFTSVTNTLQRSYRTIDLYEQASNATVALERDIQTMFNNPASGEAVRFYGEPYGFVVVGVDETNRLSRLTYVVHRDNSRMHYGGDSFGRGETVILPRSWAELDRLSQRYGMDIRAFYPVDPDNYYVDVEVEVIYGVLLRIHEKNISSFDYFGRLDPFLTGTGSTPVMPRPAYFSSETLGAAANFPWLSSWLWPGGKHSEMDDYTYEAFRTAESCHYWLQFLNGPGVPSVSNWDATDLWWQERSGSRALADRFWYDEDYPINGGPHAGQSHLQQHIVAESFVLNAYLLDPSTSQRIVGNNGAFVEVLGPSEEPIFRYAVEDSAKGVTFFNTLFNMNFKDEDSEPGLMRTLMENLGDSTVVDNFGVAMTRSRHFYDVGNPLQGRAPVVLDLCLWTLQAPPTPGGATLVHRFAKNIYLPTGYMRPKQAKR